MRFIRSRWKARRWPAAAALATTSARCCLEAWCWRPRSGWCGSRCRRNGTACWWIRRPFWRRARRARPWPAATSCPNSSPRARTWPWCWPAAMPAMPAWCVPACATCWSSRAAPRSFRVSPRPRRQCWTAGRWARASPAPAPACSAGSRTAPARRPPRRRCRPRSPLQDWRARPGSRRWTAPAPRCCNRRPGRGPTAHPGMTPTAGRPAVAPRPDGARMNVISPRNAAPAVNLSQAIAAGLAPDGGLYVPQALPAPRQLRAGATLAETTSGLLAPFFAGDALEAELPAICAEAFDFPVPLLPLATPNDHVLELFHGPTAAFKDIGARFLAACLARIRRGAERPLTILVATSGDTGAAVAAAFHGQPGLRVVVLYPDGRVSPRQAHQLGCFGDNVSALRVAGSFDDCQALVKRALNDAELQAQVPLSSANSISLGRLLPQMSYYAHASLTHHAATGRELNFVVPTGNLGNALAGILARALGAPLGRIVLATNANRVLPEFFAGDAYRPRPSVATIPDALAGILARALGAPLGRIVLATNANRVLPEFFAGDAYSPRPSVATIANAMDVGAPSNFERLLWLYGGDEAALREGFTAIAVGDDLIRTTIRTRSQLHGEVFCPHTATAVHVLQEL